MEKEIEKLLGRKMKVFEQMAYNLAVKNRKDEFYAEINSDGTLTFKTFCKCTFKLVNRNQLTYKAYCFECEQQIKESNI